MEWLSPLRHVAALALCLSTAAAQELPAREAALAKEAVALLIGYARTAQVNKAGPQERLAYELIVGHYDADHRTAREKLGFRKKGESWEAPVKDAAPPWHDLSDPAQKRRVTDAWARIAKKLGEQHRALGLAARDAGDDAFAVRHFELTLVYEPADRPAHEALGHVEHQGFFGTAEQVGFLQRLAALEARAREIATADVKVEAIPEVAMPEELRRMGLPITGARSELFTVWTHSTQAETDEIARWCQRAFVLLEHLLDQDHGTRSQIRGNARRYVWLGILRTHDERDRFFTLNPRALGKQTFAEVSRFGGHDFAVRGGTAEICWQRADPPTDHDHAVAWVTQRCIGGYCNAGLGQGLVHAMTALLLGTTLTGYGELPSTEASGDAPGVRSSPGNWNKLLREQIKVGKDWPLVHVPRETYARFRPEARIKSWSFVTWLLARHPDRWLAVLRAFDEGEDKVPLPEDVAKILAEALGERVDLVEAEWREWARGDSAIARASGHGAN